MDPRVKPEDDGGWGELCGKNSDGGWDVGEFRVRRPSSSPTPRPSQRRQPPAQPQQLLRRHLA